MDHDDPSAHDKAKSAIERQLRRCRGLMLEFPDEPSAGHLRELERDLLEKLRTLRQ
jgi:hypothetical protein